MRFVYTDFVPPAPLLRLARGEADAAVVPTCELEWAVEAGLLVRSDFRVLDETTRFSRCARSSKLFPSVIFGASSSLDASAARAIAMLPILTGNVGLPGTSTGMEEDGTNWEPVYLPTGDNKVKTAIPCFLWTEAILRGKTMDAVHDGLRGKDVLGHDIKMIVNSGGNVLINQHADSNGTDEILRETTKCEFIVVCDNMMTPSARYADILLPDTLGPETYDIVGNGDSMGDLACMYPMHKAVDPQWEQRPSWEICRGITRELGLEDAYTEGRDQMGWILGATKKRAARIPNCRPSTTSGRRGRSSSST